MCDGQVRYSVCLSVIICLCCCVLYLALSLLVLQRTVKQDNSRIFDHPPHPRVGHILVDHHPSQDTRVLDDPTWNLNMTQLLEEKEDKNP